MSQKHTDPNLLKKGIKERYKTKEIFSKTNDTVLSGIKIQYISISKNN